MNTQVASPQQTPNELAVAPTPPAKPAWSKPRYERTPLSEALSGGITNSDGGYNFSS